MLTPDRLDEAVVLSRQAGWPHRREDWALVLDLSHGFAAVQDGRLVGTALATPFGTTTATINMVLVEQALRGRGLGRRLMEAALAHTEGQEQRLIATRDGLPLYEKLGFVPVVNIVQHQGATPLPVSAAGTVEWLMPGDDTAALARCDAAASGLDRSALLRVLSRAGAVGVLRRGREIEGYVVLRAFGRGEVVGPIVARSFADARELAEAAFARSSGGFVRVDTPDPELGAWLEGRNLAAVGGGIAMVRRPRQRAAAPFHIYALASQALG
jgi:GNAT superfamily N-acetyltransferase